MPRKALIGEFVKLPDGRKGKVTGINADTLVARVSVAGEPGLFVDVPQADLTHIPKKPL